MTGGHPSHGAAAAAADIAGSTPIEVWTPAFVGLGSNLDDPKSQIVRAATSLAGLPQTRVQRYSPLYRSAPLGPQDQPDYVNAVVALLTRLEPGKLLEGLLALEQQLGRSRNDRHWGPRRIDLDLLLFGDTVQTTKTLTLPHPGLIQRAFVLQPLADLTTCLRLPGGCSIVQALGQIDLAGLHKLGELAELVET